jgi:hypothetical protein
VEDRDGHGDSSTGSELKAAEEACREASRTAEPLNDWNVLSGGILTVACCLVPIRVYKEGTLV